ncbi:FAD-binding oxidoreductase [Cryobacterium sp. Hh7]|uniref:NAD(P)/FAD-dependent oxidoreductase n=1 Tax=Cryobacterium sp. Hh7 TaxID=1259159 RepID=UPI00106C9614|nr:FAD-binding oxidoreductase [Cryobacterium sp. Hh7]TFD50700.1 FAD-binding oxidoreductase [Cryobacterium sp. Hh7]
MTISAPKSVVVVGAGIVGLSLAWHLQEHGVPVTVLDKATIGAGASWGNAGWVSPGLVTPLAEPGAWRHALQAVIDRDASLSIPARFDPDLFRFLLKFGRNMTATRWLKTLTALQPITHLAEQGFVDLITAGVQGTLTAAPITLGFTSATAAEAYTAELEHLQHLGQKLTSQANSDPGETALFSPAITHSVHVDDQSYIDPGAFVEALAQSVRARGGIIIENCAVTDVQGDSDSSSVLTGAGDTIHADAVAIATGAWLPHLSRRLGVTVGVQSGRGYSFTVDTAQKPTGTLYFPTQRVVGTPYQGALRIAGTMEFRRPDAPLDPRRATSVRNAVQPLMTGVDWSSTRDVWVGARPVTPDGLPVIGRTRSSRIYASGGHGMWGIVLGPVSGRLLAQQIMTGNAPPELANFDPRR